jgi:hypothetical protein
MADFSQQIAGFINYGTYNYQFDSVGNEILNQSSSIFQQVYFTLPLGNFVYNNSKALSFYNPTFTEFVPVPATGSSISSSFPQAAIDQINKITYQNTQLQSQLNAVVASSSMNSSSADMQSIENTIINLRIQLGQGSVPNDFQSVYPYLPIQLEQQNPPSS